MTTIRQAPPAPIGGDAALHALRPEGDTEVGPPPVVVPAATGMTRQSRRCEHRRLVREQLVVVLVLLVFLAVTLVLLGLQWLDTGSPTSAAPYLHLIGGIA